MAMPACRARSSSESRSKSSVRPASTERQLAAGADHGLNGRDADDRHVEAHILIWLGDLDDGQAALKRGRVAVASDRIRLAGALDGRVRAFHGLHGHAGLRGHHHRLANVEAGHGARHSQAVLNVLALLFVRGTRRSARLPAASSGSRKAVELISSMPSSPSTLATAPSSISVERVRRLSSSLASRQSGRMLEKICLCFTWPAITAFSTPSLWKVSISRESSPSESQWTVMPSSAAARRSISASVSSRMAATDHGQPLRPRRVQQQKRKPPVAGDEAELHGYLITPRSLRSMKRRQQRHVLAFQLLDLLESLRGVQLRQPAAAGRPSAAP